MRNPKVMGLSPLTVQILAPRVLLVGCLVACPRRRARLAPRRWRPCEATGRERRGERLREQAGQDRNPKGEGPEALAQDEYRIVRLKYGQGV